MAQRRPLRPPKASPPPPPTTIPSSGTGAPPVTEGRREAHQPPKIASAAPSMCSRLQATVKRTSLATTTMHRTPTRSTQTAQTTAQSLTMMMRIPSWTTSRQSPGQGTPRPIALVLPTTSVCRRSSFYPRSVTSLALPTADESSAFLLSFPFLLSRRLARKFPRPRRRPLWSGGPVLTSPC